MSLINQMLQDLDAQEGNAAPADVPEIASAAVKSRSRWLPGLMGMLLAAALGAGVTWVLGQPESAVPEGGLIPLALPDPPVARKRTEKNRPPAVVLRAAATGLPRSNAPEVIPVDSRSQGTEVAGRSAQAPAEPLVKPPIELAQEGSTSRLMRTSEAKPAREETQSGRIEAKAVLPQRQASGASFPATTIEADKRLPEQRPSLNTVTKPSRPSPKQAAAPDSFREARRYLEQGRLADAEEALRRTLRANPGMSRSREMLAALLLRGGRRSETATLLDQGLQLAPGQPVFLSLRARLYREQGDAAKAIALLQQGLREDRDDGDLLALLGVLYQEQGRFSEAAAVYRRILEQRPGSAKSWAGLAISLDGAGEQTTALQAYRQALANNQLSKEVAEYARQRVGVLESQ